MGDFWGPEGKMWGPFIGGKIFDVGQLPKSEVDSLGYFGGKGPKSGVHSLGNIIGGQGPKSVVNSLGARVQKVGSLHGAIIGGQCPKSGNSSWGQYWGPGSEKWGPFLIFLFHGQCPKNVVGPK